MEECIIDKVVKELQFYANPENHKAGSENKATGLSKIQDDGGDRARELIKALGGL